MTMSTPLLSGIVAFSLLSFFHPKPAVDQSYALGRWRLDIHRDAFRQERRCRLADDYGHFPRVTGDQHALTLKLANHADGATAWFSVDGAPARPWRDVEAALIADGALADAESLDNATGGLLRLPYAAINGAKTISVQVRPDGPIERYSVGGLWPMVEAANRLGCRFAEDR